MRSRRPVRAVIALLLLLALGSAVVGSATSLGGVRTEDLGAASGQTQRLSALTLGWSPTWQSGAWRTQSLTVNAAERGFRSGDDVRVTIAGSSRCELRTRVSSSTASLTFASADLTSACGQLPTLADARAVALSVAGDDTITTVTDLGEIDGSIAGFSGRVGAAAGTVTGSRGSGTTLQSVVVDVPVAPSALASARVTVTVGTSSARIGTAALDSARVAVAAQGGGARLTLDVSGQMWSVPSAADLGVAVDVPQRLTSGVSTTTGVILGSGTIAAPTTGGNGNNGTKGDGLTPVAVSPGLSYSYTKPWTGEQTNQLTFCHSFTVTNKTSTTLKDWTVQFDTTLAPMWGMDPTAAGTISLSNLRTVAYDRSTGYWTVGGATDWSRSIEAKGSRVVQFCATKVPMPAPDASLFTTKVSVVSAGDYWVTFRIDVTSTSPYYVPWQAQVDMAGLVCAASLTNHPLTFNQVAATQSGTSYTIRGTSGDTQLVSASHPRSFVFASYSPGPGWKLPCSG